jgi:hypothetical protein
MKQKLLFIATGGTISTEMDSKIQGYAAKRSGEDLISSLAMKDYQVETVNFRKINSPYITPLDMLELGKLLQDALHRMIFTGGRYAWYGNSGRNISSEQTCCIDRGCGCQCRLARRTFESFFSFQNGLRSRR